MKKNKLMLMLTLMLILPFLFLGETKAVTVGDFRGTDCYYYNGSKVSFGDCGNITSDYPYFQRKILSDNKDFFCESGALKVPDANVECETKTSTVHPYAIGYIVKNVYKNTAESYYWTEVLINHYLYDQTKSPIYKSYNRDIPSDYAGVYAAAEGHQSTYEKWANASVNISAGVFEKDANGNYYVDFNIEITEGIFSPSNVSIVCSSGSSSCNDYLDVTRNEYSNGNGTNIIPYRVKVDVSDIPYGQNVTVAVRYEHTEEFYKALEYDCGSDSSSGVEYQDIVTGYETVSKNVSGIHLETFVKENEPTTTIGILKQGKYSIAVNNQSGISGAQYILMPEQVYNYYETSKKFDQACMAGIIDVTNDYNFQTTDLFDSYGRPKGVCYRITTSNEVTKLSLPRTTYYLVEEKAPAGYLLNTTPIKFSLNENTGRIESDSENIELGKKYIYLQDTETETKISKLNVTNEKELPGATLQILDKDKKSISCIIKLSDGSLKKLDECTWVSGEVPVYVYGLAAGKYFLKETQAPEGFALSEEMVEFEVKADGTTNEVVMENALEVEVPDTLSFRSALLLFIGMFDIALGIGILLYVKKNKATE